MKSRAIALRISLAMLGVTALSGIALAVDQGSGFWAQRLLGTGIIGVIVSGISMPFGALADRPGWRFAGLGGIAFLTVQFALALVLIWLPGGRQESIAWSMLALFFTVPSLILAGLASPHRASRTAVWCALVTAAVALLMQLVDAWTTGPSAWNSSAWGRGDRIVSWSFCLLVGGLVAALSLLRAQRSFAWRWWQWATWFGVFATGLAAGLFAVVVHRMNVGGPEMVSGWFESAITLGAIGLGLGGTNAMSLLRLKGHAWTLRMLAVGALMVTLLIAVVMAWTSRGSLLPMLGASIIVTISALLATLVLARFQREPEYAEATSEFASIEVTCPRCRGHETQPLGNSSCKRCGLRYNILVEAPKCAGCGHTLLHLTRNTCPECGRAIATIDDTQGPQLA